MKRVGFLLFIVLALFSCTVRQDISINSDGSGSINMDIQLMGGFYDYLLEIKKDLGDLTDTDPKKVFNLDSIREKLSELPGITITRLQSPDPKRLIIQFSFKDINQLIDKSKDYLTEGDKKNIPDVITFQKQGGQIKLRFYLDGKNLGQILPMIPVSDNPLFDALGPNPDEPISEDEYYELVEFTIGEGGPDMVKKSEIMITVTAGSQILSQTGGKITGGKVLFALPLIKFVLLLEPIEYAVVFK